MHDESRNALKRRLAAKQHRVFVQRAKLRVHMRAQPAQQHRRVLDARAVEGDHIGGDERFRRAIKNRQRGEAKDIAGALQLHHLPPAIGQQLVKHDGAVHDLIDAVSAIPFAENMAMLANTLALPGRFFIAMVGRLNSPRFTGFWQSAAGRLGIEGMGSRRDRLLHWGVLARPQLPGVFYDASLRQ
jgi:hypothetical protein